jgi:hypothetical protein
MCGAAGETAADLFGHVKLSTREGSGSGDRVIRAAIAPSLRLKEREYTFAAISRPCRDGSIVRLGSASAENPQRDSGRLQRADRL